LSWLLERKRNITRDEYLDDDGPLQRAIFNGTDSYLNYGNTNASMPCNDRSFVIIQAVEIADLSTFRLLNNRGTGTFGTTAGYQVSVSHSSGHFGNFAVDNGAQHIALDNVNVPPLVINTPYVMAMNWENTSGRLEIWLDGVQIGSKALGALSGANFETARVTAFGVASNGFSAHAYDGKLDWIKYYSADDNATDFSAAMMGDVFNGITPANTSINMHTEFRNKAPIDVVGPKPTAVNLTYENI